MFLPKFKLVYVQVHIDNVEYIMIIQTRFVLSGNRAQAKVPKMSDVLADN